MCRVDRIGWVDEGNPYHNEGYKHTWMSAEGMNIDFEGIISGLIESPGDLIDIFSN